MGDARYNTHLESIVDAPDRARAIREMADDAVIQALAAASRHTHDPYLANVLATEAMNRMDRARTIAAHIGDGVYALDRHGRVTYVNSAAERLLGWSRGELIGTDMHDRIHATDAEGHVPAADECVILRPLTSHVLSARDDRTFLRKDGTRFPATFVSAPIRRDGDVVGVVVAFRDATERKRTESLLAGQAQLLERIATGDQPIERVLDDLCRFIESQSEGVLASVLLAEGSTGRLRHGAAPSLPAEYIRGIDGVQMGPSEGSCGTAAYLNKPVYVPDIPASPLWTDYRDLALAHGLHACWSMPIRGTDGMALGTFALYTREPQEPSPVHVRLLEVASHLAGLAIEQTLARERLRTAAAVIEATSDSVIAVDGRGRISAWNAGAERLYGYTAEEALGKEITLLVPPELMGRSRTLYDRLLAGEHVNGHRTRRRHRDGRVMNVSLTAAPLRDATGAIVGFSGISREIDAETPPERAVDDDEAARLAALRRYRLLDTPPKPELDALTQLASKLCNTPIALVSLVDENRQYFKARVGLLAPQTDRSLSFCAHAIREPREPLIVEDATQDPRFRDNDLVTGPPHIRFYAGIPLVTSDGYALGSLCVIDRKPRTLTEDQLDGLHLLAQQVIQLIELRQTITNLSEPSVGFKPEGEDQAA